VILLAQVTTDQCTSTWRENTSDQATNKQNQSKGNAAFSSSHILKKLTVSGEGFYSRVSAAGDLAILYQHINDSPVKLTIGSVLSPKTG
jgi:hypothetical protein